jgi:hypothetical protein
MNPQVGSLFINFLTVYEVGSLAIDAIVVDKTRHALLTMIRLDADSVGAQKSPATENNAFYSSVPKTNILVARSSFYLCTTSGIGAVDRSRRPLLKVGVLQPDSVCF